MSLPSILIRIKNRLGELWEHSAFRYAIFLHVFYYILSLILVLVFLREQNDFLIFFKAGGIFLNNIEDLYNQENYLWDFRYFPLSAMFFVPFYLLGFDLGFIFFHTLNLVLNILICIILYKIIMISRGEDHEKDDKRVILYICIYIMAIPHVFNYILGQINLYIIVLILTSLYIFLKHETLKWQFIGSVIFGISIIIKPIALFLAPFLLIINLDLRNKKIIINFPKSAVRALGAFLPLSLNFILFLMYPKLLEGFMATNFTGINPITINFSFSVTKLVLNFCYIINIPFNQLYVLIGVIGIFGGVGFVIFMIGEKDRYSIIHGYTLGILIMLLIYFDSWDHHLLILLPLLIIVIFSLPRRSKIAAPYFKKSFFYLSYFPMLFMGLWFLTAPLYPFNFVTTFFLIVVYIGICKCHLGMKINQNCEAS